MNNFQHATEATNTALESQGSANRENSRYMESLTAHITALKAAFQDLSRAVLDSGFLESLLDVLTKIVKTLADNPWLVQIGLMTAGITSIAALTKNFLPILAAFTSGLGGLSAVAGTAGAAGALGTFATVLGSIAPYALAASAAIVGLIAIYKAWKDAHPDIETMNEQLKTNRERLSELNNIPYKSRTTEMNEEIAALEKENKVLEENIRKKKQANAQQLAKDTITQYSSAPTYSVDIGGVSYEAKSLDALIDKLKQARIVSDDYIGSLKEYHVKTTDATDGVQDMIDAVRDYNNKLLTGKELTGDETKQYQEYSTKLKDFADNINDAADAGANIDQKWLDLASAAETVVNSTDKVDTEMANQKEALNKVASGCTYTTGAYEALIKKYPELEKYMTVIEGSIEDGNALWGLNRSALYSAAAAGDSWAASMLENIYDVYTAQLALNKAQVQSNDYSPSGTQRRYKDIDTTEMLKVYSALQKYKLNKDDDDDGGGGTTIITTGGGGSSKSKSDKSTKDEDERLKLLQSIVSLRKSEADLTAEQTDDADKLVAKYKSVQSALHDQANYMRSNLAKMKKQGASQQEINAYQESIVSLSKEWYSWESKIKNVLQEQAEAKKKAAKEALEERKAAAEQEQDELEKIAEYAQAVADAQIKKIDEQIDALDKVNDELDDQIQKQQLLEALATAKSKQLYVYKDGQFQYVEDTESISKAQQDLADFEREQRQKKEKEALEAEKQRWEDYKDGWGDLTKSYTTEQGKLLYEQKYGADIENQNWTTRLRNLADFVSEYNSLLSQINSMQTQLDMEQYGDMYLDQATQDYINEQKRLYNEARARGDWKAMEEANKNANEARGLGRVTTATGDIAGVRGGGTSSGGGGGGGSYTVGSGRGQSFLNEAPAGSTMTGADGSRWTKNNDGSTTITRGGETYHVPSGSSTGTRTSGGSSSSSRGSSSKSSSSKSSSSGGSALKNAISNALSKVIGKKKAHGTYSAEGGLTLVGENGPELRVLNQGDGILPTNLTRSLFQVASNPSLATMRNGGNISTHINISNVTLPNVKDAESLVDGLKNLAYQRAYART